MAVNFTRSEIHTWGRGGSLEFPLPNFCILLNIFQGRLSSTCALTLVHFPSCMHPLCLHMLPFNKISIIFVSDLLSNCTCVSSCSTVLICSSNVVTKLGGLGTCPPPPPPPPNLQLLKVLLVASETSHAQVKGICSFFYEL